MILKMNIFYKYYFENIQTGIKLEFPTIILNFYEVKLFQNFCKFLSLQKNSKSWRELLLNTELKIFKIVFIKNVLLQERQESEKQRRKVPETEARKVYFLHAYCIYKLYLPSHNMLQDKRLLRLLLDKKGSIQHRPSLFSPHTVVNARQESDLQRFFLCSKKFIA